MWYLLLVPAILIHTSYRPASYAQLNCSELEVKAAGDYHVRLALEGYTGFQVLLLLPTFLYQVKDTKSNIGQVFNNTGSRMYAKQKNYYFAISTE